MGLADRSLAGFGRRTYVCPSSIVSAVSENVSRQVETRAVREPFLNAGRLLAGDRFAIGPATSLYPRGPTPGTWERNVPGKSRVFMLYIGRFGIPACLPRPACSVCPPAPDQSRCVAPAA